MIDKTTGKGCALRLMAKPITKKLIADGIVGNVIAKKSRYNRHVLLWVMDCGENQIYINWCFADEVAEASFWVPSFIDAEAWERAVSKFHIDESLDNNVAEYLLPEMEEYLQRIPDAELISMTKNFLIEHGVLNKPICQHKGKTYYFDDDEVYSLDRGAERFPYEGKMKFNIFQINTIFYFNITVWRKAASWFQVGMTLEECVGIFLKTELIHRAPQEPSPVDRLVQYIAPPICERNPENTNKATFDRIRVTVGVPRYQFNSWKALQKEVKKYQKEIYQRVVQRLEQDRQFKKYGVPISFLKLSHVMLLRDFSLELIFELKEQSELS